jgi:hypothetical protein
MEVSDAYNCYPLQLIDRLKESDILDVEAPLCSESSLNFDVMEIHAFS